MPNNSNNIVNSLAYDPVLFDTESFNKLLKDHGIALRHYKAMVCPLGVISLDDSQAPHYEHGICSNGFVYEYAGEVEGFVSNNTAVTQLTEMGILDGSVIQVTFPKYYTSDPQKEVYVQLNDRFFIKNVAALTPTTEKVEFNIKGLDKLIHLAVKVESIMDSNGIKYSTGDYQVVDGRIQWISNHRPGYNPDLNKGVIYSIRYLYEPFFYVSKLLHEVRIINKVDFRTNEKIPIRAPYAAFLSREYYLYKTQNNPTIPGANADPGYRNMIQPRDGSFPPG